MLRIIWCLPVIGVNISVRYSTAAKWSIMPSSSCFASGPAVPQMWVTYCTSGHQTDNQICNHTRGYCTLTPQGKVHFHPDAIGISIIVLFSFFFSSVCWRLKQGTTKVFFFFLFPRRKHQCQRMLLWTAWLLLIFETWNPTRSLIMILFFNFKSSYSGNAPLFHTDVWLGSWFESASLATIKRVSDIFLRSYESLQDRAPITNRTAWRPHRWSQERWCWRPGISWQRRWSTCWRRGKRVSL